MTKTVSIIVVNENEKILALKRSPDKKWYPDKWDIISGKIEKDEEGEDGFRRELLEELGVDSPRDIESKDTYVYEESGLRWLVHPYRCRICQNNIKLNQEHYQYKWVTIEEMLNLDLADPVKLELSKFYQIYES